MSTDLMQSLRDLGEFNDSWAEGKLAESQGAGGGAGLLHLAPPVDGPPGHRRWLMAAAAALVVLAGAVAVVTNRSQDQLPVASEPTTVALVPSSLEGWDEVDVEDLRSGDEDISIDGGTVTLARPATDPIDSQWIRLSTFEVSGEVTPPPDAETIDVGGTTAWLTGNAGGGWSIQVWPASGTGQLLVAATGTEVSREELVEVVASFDPEVLLSEQPAPDGWVTAVDGSDAALARVRTVMLHNQRAEPGSSDWQSVSVSIVTVTGIPPERAMWFLVGPQMSSVALRGTDGLMSSIAGGDTQGTFRSLNWVEDPRTAVGISYSASGDVVDVESWILELADDLVAVDAEGWDAFVERVAARTGGDGGSTGVEGVPAPTIVDDGGTTETTVPVFPDTPEATSLMEGAFGEGPIFQLFVAADTGQLCWRFEGSADPRCDPPGADPAQPRLAVDEPTGTTLVYALLPPGAVDVEVTAVSQTQRLEVLPMLGEGFWVAPLPSGYGAADVRYLDADGNVVAEASMA